MGRRSQKKISQSAPGDNTMLWMAMRHVWPRSFHHGMLAQVNLEFDLYYSRYFQVEPIISLKFCENSFQIAYILLYSRVQQPLFLGHLVSYYDPRNHQRTSFQNQANISSFLPCNDKNDYNNDSFSNFNPCYSPMNETMYSASSESYVNLCIYFCIRCMHFRSVLWKRSLPSFIIDISLVIQIVSTRFPLLIFQNIKLNYRHCNVSESYNRFIWDGWFLIICPIKHWYPKTKPTFMPEWSFCVQH